MIELIHSEHAFIEKLEQKKRISSTLLDWTG
jgi:hypothetical protein